MSKFYFFILLLSFNLNAQTDTEFWFVAPEVTNGYDSPILLRVSAFSQPAAISLTAPANPAFAPINVSIPANTTYSIDLTPLINQVENKPPGQVLNYGLLLKSDVPVTAYYEVNRGNNPDIFSLKGNNAKGKEFYTPFQTRYSTGNYPGPPSSGFDIVATEDNTQVIITPSKSVFGHPAGTPFTITLNRGQTYSCATNNGSPAARPAGSHIVSNKPVCVTIKDDLVQNSNCADLHGDQLVPVDILGTDYIAMRGNLSSPERVYILATQASTDIFLDGAAIPSASLNAGEQFEVSLNAGDSTLFIQASAPVYVLHLAGFTCEMGAALLPPIECTGSSSVFFNRSTNEYFALNIMCRTGSETSFSLNGNPALVPPSAFHPVAGTGGNWQSAQISYSTAQVPAGSPSVIANNHPTDNFFHLGIIHGGNSTGCRFGYFSDYNSLNLGGNRTICVNDTLLLDAGAGKNTYLWNTGDTTRYLSVTLEGVYWVSTRQAGCSFTDTVNVAFDNSGIDLGPDTTLCSGDSIILKVPAGFSSYRWQDQSTDSVFIAKASGNYMLIARSNLGCEIRDTMALTVRPLPPAPQIQADTVICEGDTLILKVSGDDAAAFTWFSPDGTQFETDSLFIDPGKEGIWRVTQMVNGCPGPEGSVYIRMAPNPQPVIVGDTIICEGFLTDLLVPGNYTSWLWSSGQNSAGIQTGEGTYQVTVTNADGCSAISATVEVNLIGLQAGMEALPAADVPLGAILQFNDKTLSFEGFPVTAWRWDFGNGDTSSLQNPSYTYPEAGNYTVILIVTNSASCSDTIQLNINVFGNIVIPNAFSPNNDGINDLFVIQNLEYFPSSRLLIYNRWGRLVFSDEHYQNNWDGDGLPDGTYFYLLRQGGKEPEFKGTVFMGR